MVGYPVHFATNRQQFGPLPRACDIPHTHGDNLIRPICTKSGYQRSPQCEQSMWNSFPHMRKEQDLCVEAGARTFTQWSVSRILDIFAGRYGYLQICTSTSRQGCYFELHLRPVLRPALAANSSESQSVTCGFLLSESKSSVVPKTDQKGSGPRIKQARTTRTPRLSVRRRLALTSMTAMRGARAPHPSASRRPGPVAPA